MGLENVENNLNEKTHKLNKLNNKCIGKEKRKKKKRI